MPILYKKIFNTITNIIYPPSCLGCHALLNAKQYFCASCQHNLHFIQAPYCTILGLPLPKHAKTNAISFEALMEPPPFRRARAIFKHVDLARSLIALLKYGDRLDLIPFFIEYLTIIGKELLEETDIIVPIPLHYRRFFFRHYNQAAELAKALAKLNQKAYQPFALKKIKHTVPQTTLGRKSRLKNMNKIFICNPNKIKILHGKNILLIDDVYTTGATIKAACYALEEAKVKNIDVLTLSNSYKYNV